MSIDCITFTERAKILNERVGTFSTCKENAVQENGIALLQPGGTKISVLWEIQVWPGSGSDGDGSIVWKSKCNSWDC